MGKKEDSTKCFFCQEDIPITEELGAEQYTQDHGYGGYYYRDSYFKLGGVNNVSLTFNPSYLDALDNLTEQAERETQAEKERWCNKFNALLVEANEYLGNLSKLVINTCVPNYYGNNHEHESARRRLAFAREFFKLETLGYAIDGGRGLYSFAAHAACVKPILTLEDIANNPLSSEQFKVGLQMLPEPMRKLYNKLKTREVKVEI